MKVFREVNLMEYEFYSGAKDVADRLTEEEFSTLENLLEEVYEIIDETTLNDFMWFDAVEVLGLSEDEFYDRPKRWE